MARHYNKQAKPRHLDIGELVLRRVMPTTRELAHGKPTKTRKDLTRLSTTSGEVLTTQGTLDEKKLPHPWNTEH